MVVAFLWPYTVSVQRLQQTFSATEGAAQSLTVIYAALPANIAVKRDKGFNKPPGYPSASETPTPMPMYDIMIGQQLAMGSVQNGDMLTDQTGMQYRVDAALWLPMGYNLYCGPYVATA